jgi:hypothetical protein
MMIQLPTPATAGPAAEYPAPEIWGHLAEGAVDPDLQAALDDLATSGDEVVARLTTARVGLPRAAGLAALRSVAVDDIPRRPDRF